MGLLLHHVNQPEWLSHAWNRKSSGYYTGTLI